MARWVTCVLLVFCTITGRICAQTQAPVTVAMEPARHDVALGETVTLNVSVTNNSAASDPITLVATVSYTPRGGTPQVSTATLDLAVRRPLHVDNVMLSIPDPLSYVPNSATYSGKPLPATLAGQSLTVTLNQDIAELGKLLFTINVIRNR